ncbi:MAG: twitch domain-containing radical SAM protein [Bacteriovoracaceae bacterium]|nr:twitch domain-containing radical SAM protein [Bacteriovoracaceae bacterium]
MDLNRKEKIERIERINHVSSCFCLAKWLQVTVDLVHGTNHSCHHPVRQNIPLEGLEENPSSLHNTKYKKILRRQMLNGRRPAECKYCWQIEDVVGYEWSDRMIKSLDEWAFPYLDEIIKLPWDADVTPTYVEVMFDKICNMSCGYCISGVSSSIENEMEKYGPFKFVKPYRAEEGCDFPLGLSQDEGERPYVRAFWKWLPDIAKKLHVLRITGGEPLLSKNTFKILDYFDENPSENLILALNTNLCVDDKIIDRFIDRLKPILQQGKIKQFEIYTSVDTFGGQAEYIRKGLNYRKFVNNICKFKESFSDVSIVINVTYGIYSIPSFKKFLEEIYELKQKYGRLVVDISYLSSPEYLRANMVTEDFYPTVRECLDYMESKFSPSGDDGFSRYEIDKFTRVYLWIIAKAPPEEHNFNRAGFYAFVSQFDKRYYMEEGRFIEVFPEYRKFMVYCRKAFWFINKLTA